MAEPKYESVVESLDEIETRAYKCGLEAALELMEKYGAHTAAVKAIRDQIESCQRELEALEE